MTGYLVGELMVEISSKFSWFSETFEDTYTLSHLQDAYKINKAVETLRKQIYAILFESNGVEYLLYGSKML